MRENWKYQPLGEICDLLNGFAFKSNLYVNEGIRVIRIANVQKGYIEDSAPAFYPFSYEDELSRYMLQEGDLLMSLTGNVGRVGILNKEMLPAALNQRVACIRLKKKDVLLKYLFHYFNSDYFEKMCIASSHGAAQLNMSTVWLAKHLVPVPPLSEQERIVALLDDQFAKIDALKANAASQLQAAKDLFQSALKEMLTPKEGWEEKHLGEVCDFSSGFAFKSNLFTSVGEPIIRISDIQEGRVIEDSVAKFDIKSYDIDLSKYIVYPGDILIAMSGGTTGKVGINYTDKCFYLNQRVGVFREKKNILNHKYLYFYLQTKSDESLKIAAGAAQPNLSTAQIKDFVIPIPSLPEQERIAARLDAISEKVKALQANYDQTINLCNDLKQSLLKSTLA